jgi:hypothetical protein
MNWKDDIYGIEQIWSDTYKIGEDTYVRSYEYINLFCRIKHKSIMK